MQLITWNVLHPDCTEKYDEKYASIINYENRLKNIAKYLRENNADIICLQEIDLSSFDEDYREFKDEYQLIPQNCKSKIKKIIKWKENGGDKPNTIGCATLVKKRYDILETISGSRTLTTTIYDKDSNKTIKIANVHLEAGKDTTMLHIKHLSKLLDCDIICGDFNDFPGEPFAEYLVENGFTSADIHCRSSINYTYLSICGNKMFIDHIFYKKETVSCSEIEYGVAGVLENLASDHCPIRIS